MNGAEALQKLLDDVDNLTAVVKSLATSVQLIEANIKTLNNRAAGLMRGEKLSTVMPTNTLNLSAEAPIRPTVQQLPSKQIEVEINDDHLEAKGALTYKKVFGKLVNNAGEAIDGALLKVYDKNNEVCAAIETDPTGYWSVMIKPGRYVAECTKAGFRTVNKTFEVDKNSVETEVK